MLEVTIPEVFFKKNLFFWQKFPGNKSLDDLFFVAMANHQFQSDPIICVFCSHAR